MRSHLPDNFPIQQKDRLFCKAIFSFLLRKQPSLLLNGEVIWQASDFSLTKELHAETFSTIIYSYDDDYDDVVQCCVEL